LSVLTHAGKNISETFLFTARRRGDGISFDGTYVTKNIEDIQAGDYVLARSQGDPTAPLELKQVTAVYVHEVTQEQVLTVQDAQGRTETITCTPEHPFWVPGRGWTGAADLVPGTELTSPDGSMVVVVSNTAVVLAEPVNVYNFQVEGDHTYFVDDGAEPVWVHNNCATDLAQKLGSEGEEAAGILKNTEHIVSLSGRAAYRIPDELTETTLTEVKNVAYQHFSTQLQDSLHYAIMTGREMILKVRANGATKLSGELRQAINAGWIKLVEMI